MREITATVLENKRIADEVYSLTFAADDEIAVRPGQFVMIGVGGYPLRRPIAVCKSEGERITVCYRLKGDGTRSLARDYKMGEKLSVLLPLGNGFYVKDTEKKVALVGGGVGIFPLISVIRAYSKSKELYAYMGFRNRAAFCMEYDLAQTKKIAVATDDGSLGFHGTAVQAFMRPRPERGDEGQERPRLRLFGGAHGLRDRRLPRVRMRKDERRARARVQGRTRVRDRRRRFVRGAVWRSLPRGSKGCGRQISARSSSQQKAAGPCILLPRLCKRGAANHSLEFFYGRSFCNHLRENIEKSRHHGVGDLRVRA